MRSPLAPLAGVALALAACGDGGGGVPREVARAAEARAHQAEQVARQAGLPEEVQRFFGDAARAAGARFTVRYRLDGGESGGGEVVVAQDPPRRRVDAATGRGPDQRVSTLVVTGEGTFACAQVRDRWRCETTTDTPPELGGFDPEQMAATVASLAASAESWRFTVEARRIAGVTASCLRTTPRQRGAGTEGRMCISAAGAPLLVETGATRLRATRYSTSVDNRAFDLPADPA